MAKISAKATKDFCPPESWFISRVSADFPVKETYKQTIDNVVFMQDLSGITVTLWLQKSGTESWENSVLKQEIL